MNRVEVAPGAFVTEVPGDKFKRGLVQMSLVCESKRETASALAVLPHVLERRCQMIPDTMALSRRLFDLYGADLSADSYTAGAARVVSVGVSGIKNKFAMNSEDLAGEYLNLLFALGFHPLLENGVFTGEDTQIERDKQADYLKSEMNDKRSYCLRQGRRKLFGASPLGIEGAGYLEDMPAVTPAALAAVWKDLLQTAQVEMFCCGVPAEKAAAALQTQLAFLSRNPVALPARMAAPKAKEMEAFTEPMDTAQGKLCIMATGGGVGNVESDAVLRVANAVLGGLPTSRLFMNVREKQSLCYYCASSYAALSGVLTMDSGIEHKNADKAAEAMLAELTALQGTPPTDAEMDDAKRAIVNSFNAAKDAPDAMAGFSFVELLKGTGQTLDEAAAAVQAVTKEQVRDALTAFSPAVRYTITKKEGA